MINLSDVAEQCRLCCAESTRSLDNLLTQLRDCQAENEQLKAQPPSADVTTLLDLLGPDIQAKETIILNDERLIQIVAAYRSIRPL